MPYRPPRYGGYVGGYPQNVRGGALAAYAIGQGLQAFGDIWGRSIQAKGEEAERLKAEQKLKAEQAAAVRRGQIGEVEGAIAGAGSVAELQGATDLRNSYLPDPAGRTMMIPEGRPGAGYAVNIAQDQSGQRDAARLEKMENRKMPVLQEQEEEAGALKRLDAALARWREGDKDIPALAEIWDVGEGALSQKITGEEQADRTAELDLGSKEAKLRTDEAAATKAERELLGGEDEGPDPTFIRNLSSDFMRDSGDYQMRLEAHAAIDRATKDPSPAGDVSLIFSFMKMIDPDSVVREGEFATAEQAGEVPARIMNLYNRLVGGERLNDTQRKDFRRQARGFLDTAEQKHGLLIDRYKRIAKEFKFNPNLVITNFKEILERGGNAPSPERGQALLDMLQERQKRQGGGL